jgi:hypothetical protein
METRYIVGMLAAALLVGTYVFEFALVPGGAPLPSDYFQGPEALQWLKKSENESALASNRFLETENAVKFVKKLYAAGATEVLVPDDAIVAEGETKYADALVVKLPEDATRRQQVLDLCAPELAREGASVDEIGQETQVYLWWD